jgi:hypothetical protein
MPEISRFFGIIIAMFFDEHNPPHFTLVTGKTEPPSKSEHSKSWKAGYHHVRWGWSLNGLRTIRRSCFKTGNWLAKTNA